MGDSLSQTLKGKLLENESMVRHTSWRVGGPAQRFYLPEDLQDLAVFVAQLPTQEPLYWIGLGSNLLVRDGGIAGTVICTKGVLGKLEMENSNLVRAEAGVSCAKVARFCTRQGLKGAEFLAGIPGTMGGALAMNAGAFGGETWDIVQSVETLDRNGNIRVRKKQEFQIAYRSVEGLDGEWFVAAHIQLKQGDEKKMQMQVRQLLNQRGASQPIGEPSCGSVFRNPKNDHAARLIELAGLKGACIGQACVSDKHANFIINRGHAKAADIEALIEHVKQMVLRKFGVKLQTEVKIVGQATILDDSARGEVQ